MPARDRHRMRQPHPAVLRDPHHRAVGRAPTRGDDDGRLPSPASHNDVAHRHRNTDADTDADDGAHHGSPENDPARSAADAEAVAEADDQAADTAPRPTGA